MPALGTACVAQIGRPRGKGMAPRTSLGRGGQISLPGQITGYEGASGAKSHHAEVTSDPGGFEPPISGLEGRCHIRAWLRVPVRIPARVVKRRGGPRNFERASGDMSSTRAEERVFGGDEARTEGPLELRRVCGRGRNR